MATHDAPQTVRSHRDLTVWQRAVDLVVEIYRISNLMPAEERYGLTSQLRRAVTSIPANIAEGHGRLRRGEYLHHLSIARGSLKELETLLALVERLEYVDRAELAAATLSCDAVSRMLTRLRHSLRQIPPPSARRPRS